jgi:hypothetical protein
MVTLLRRLFWLALLGGAGYAGWTVWQRQQAATAAAAPEWPPLDSSEPAAPAGFAAIPTDDSPATDAVETASEGPTWVEPLDGECPDGYPVKANQNSGIYHVPGGRFYDRTVPERCYARADDAEADGYRASKS